jgi:hypothetical protein
MKNGPWQFDFNIVLLKDYDGAIRPSDMVFKKMEIWARVKDLPMDWMNRAYGKLIGNWLGEFISVDVDEDGIAWGEELRIRIAISIDTPILRGVRLMESADDEVGHWFDVQYEKIPHFCFDCGRLIHPGDGCEAEKSEVKQWGEWLRAPPGRSGKPAPPPRPTVSSNSFSSRSKEADGRGI